MADLDGVAGGDVDGGFEDRAREHAVVAALGEPGGVGGGAGEEVEEVSEAVGVEAHLRGELPEDGAEFGAEGEEVREGLVDAAQLLHVGDEAGALDGEEEVFGSLAGPALEAGVVLEGVEGAVDLDGVEGVGGELELETLLEFGRVEDAAPALVAPAGDADADVADGGWSNGGFGLGTNGHWGYSMPDAVPCMRRASISHGMADRVLLREP